MRPQTAYQASTIHIIGIVCIVLFYYHEKKKKVLDTCIPDTLQTLAHCQRNHLAEIPDETATKGEVTGSSYVGMERRSEPSTLTAQNLSSLPFLRARATLGHNCCKF